MINKEILDTTGLYTVQRYSDDKERERFSKSFEKWKFLIESTVHGVSL